jgi:hypothetical protein
MIKILFTVHFTILNNNLSFSPRVIYVQKTAFKLMYGYYNHLNAGANMCLKHISYEYRTNVYNLSDIMKSIKVISQFGLKYNNTFKNIRLDGWNFK